MTLNEMNQEQLLQFASEQNELIESLKSANQTLRDRVEELEGVNDKLNAVIASAGYSNSSAETKALEVIEIDGKSYSVIKLAFRLPKNHNIIQVKNASEEELQQLLSIPGQTTLREIE